MRYAHHGISPAHNVDERKAFWSSLRKFLSHIEHQDQDKAPLGTTDWHISALRHRNFNIGVGRSGFLLYWLLRVVLIH